MALSTVISIALLTVAMLGLYIPQSTDLFVLPAKCSLLCILPLFYACATLGNYRFSSPSEIDGSGLS